MTVVNTSTIAGPYTPNGVTVAFGFSFHVMASDEIEVFRYVAATGVETVLSSSLYTVALNADNEGGTVTFAVAPATISGSSLYIRPDPAFEQPIDLENQGAFLPEVHEGAFDRAVVLSAYLKGLGLGSIRAPVGETMGALPPAATRADGYLIFDENGDPTVTTVADTLSVAIADVSGLQAALDAKAASSHTHAQSDITGLVAALAAVATLPSYSGNDGKYLGLVAGALTWQTVSGGGGGDMFLANNLAGLASTSTSRTNLGVAIGTNVQAWDAALDDFAGLTQATDKLPYFDSATTMATCDITSFGRGVLGAASYAAQLTLMSGVATTRTLTAGAGLTGGGTLASDRSFALDINGQTVLAVVDPAADYLILYDASAAAFKKVLTQNIWVQEYIDFALSDETTTITTGTAKLTWRAPFAMKVTGVRASLTTVSSSGVVTVDINDGGTTMLSTKLTVDASEKTSTTAAAAAVLSDTVIADDAEVTFDIDTAGTGAKGLKVRIYYYRTA